MENKIEISVIIPVYNTEKYLRVCLDSLLIQDFKNIEYILVDDGSTDASLEICNEYKNKDSRFLVFHKENGGPSSARNLALSKARGEYVTFVDSDDYVEAGAYSRLSEVAKRENADVVIFGAKQFPENSNAWVKDLLNTRDVVYSKFDPSILFSEVGSRPFLWLQMVKRKIITENKLKFDEKMDLGEDQIFMISYFIHASKFVYISDKLYHYRIGREGSLMNVYFGKPVLKLEKHIELIDKIFMILKDECKNKKFKTELFAWSIFFVWESLLDMLTTEQSYQANKVKNVWEKYKFESVYENLDIWGQARYDQILLMAKNETNQDEKIKDYKETIAKLDSEINELKKEPKVKKLLAKQNKKESNIKKGFNYFKQFGLKAIIKKVIDSKKN